MTPDRLIHQPAVRERLLAAVSAVPAGQRLNIPALRDALVNQADVIAGLEALISAGKLDPATLRPPVPSARVTRRAIGVTRGRSVNDELGAPLFDALVAEGARRGLSVQATSWAAFANKARIYSLRDRETCRRATADRIRAWIAASPLTDPPLEEERAMEAREEGAGAAESTPTPAPEPAPLPPAASPARSAPTGADLAAELDAFIDARGVPLGRVSNWLFTSGTGLAKLRATRSPTAATVEKVRRFLDSPPAEIFAPVATKYPKRRDPTQKPETPLMDLADRQRLNGQRHHANIKRVQERAAAAKLDSGAKPKSAFEKNMMATIERRRADEARLADPVEQAKLALQRKGRVVHSAMIHGGRKDRFMVGGQRDPRTGRLKELTPAELVDLAERVTGQTFRRAR